MELDHATASAVADAVSAAFRENAELQEMITAANSEVINSIAPILPSIAELGALSSVLDERVAKSLAPVLPVIEQWGTASSVLDQNVAEMAKTLGRILPGIAELGALSSVLDERVAKSLAPVLPVIEHVTGSRHLLEEIAEIARLVAPVLQDFDGDMAQAAASIISDVESFDSPSDFGEALTRTAPEVGKRIRSLRTREDITSYVNLLAAILSLLAVAWSVLHDDARTNQTTINNDQTIIHNEIHVTNVTVLPPVPPAG